MLEPGDLYLDHNATAPLLPEAKDALARAISGQLVNPFSAQKLLGLFSTHPPTDARIHALLQLGR